MAIPNQQQSQTFKYAIRPARSRDLPHLAPIERSASSAFITPSDPDLALIAGDEPMSIAAIQEHAETWSLFPGFRKLLSLNFKHHSRDKEVDGDEDLVLGIWVAVAYPRSSPPSPTTESGGIHRIDEDDKDEVQEGELVVGFIITSPLDVSAVQTQSGDRAQETSESSERRSRSGRKKAFIHIHELSVHVEHQRRGLAKKLMGAVKECAAVINATAHTSTVIRESQEGGADGGEGGRMGDGPPLERKQRETQEYGDTEVEILGLSLTTFRDVPFNAPFYERLGFEDLEVDRIDEVMGKEGKAIWEEERQRFSEIGDGKLAERRCWMICHCGRQS